MYALVGYTGFVGSNLYATGAFDAVYNSKNIEEAYGTRPELLVYAGVRAEMFLANQDPEADYRRIAEAMQNIERIAPRKVVLISTIAVYPDTHGVDEDTAIDASSLPAYGANRYALEQWVEHHCDRHLIIRLPAIYGKNLKKNFLYDYIHRIPAMLSANKYAELSAREPLLEQYYTAQDNGFYRCRALNNDERTLLKASFQTLGFSALNFTDSRSRYQFYPLARLWEDIQTALQHNLYRLNMAVPPIRVQEVYQMLAGEPFHNELNKPPYDYDMRTKHAALFGADDGYLMTREAEMQAIQDFVYSAIRE